MKRFLKLIALILLLAALYYGSFQSLHVISPYGDSGQRDVKLLGLTFAYTPAAQRLLSTFYRPLAGLRTITGSMNWVGFELFDPATSQVRAGFGVDQHIVFHVPPHLVPTVSSISGFHWFKVDYEAVLSPEDIGSYQWILKSVTLEL